MENPVKVCNYDGGDCCLVSVNTSRCSECVCYLKEFCSFVNHAMVGDGFCNDDLNIPECDYDQGDCCLSNLEKSFLSPLTSTNTCSESELCFCKSLYFH